MSKLVETVARAIDPDAWARRDADAARREECYRNLSHGWEGTTLEEWVERSVQPSLATARAALTAIQSEGSGVVEPIPMILFCPVCRLQHIDKADEPPRLANGDVAHGCELCDGDDECTCPGWKPRWWINPPHRSHLCHGCGCIWRPADVPTNGVASIETAGKADTFDLSAKPIPSQLCERLRGLLEKANLDHPHLHPKNPENDINDVIVRDGRWVANFSTNEAAELFVEAIAVLPTLLDAPSPQRGTSE